MSPRVEVPPKDNFDMTWFEGSSLSPIEKALALVKRAGYVVLKEKSYRQAQERQRVAEALREDAEDDAEHARSWARDCLSEERRMRDRVTHLYGVAKAHGATDDECRTPEPVLPDGCVGGHSPGLVGCSMGADVP